MTAVELRRAYRLGPGLAADQLSGQPFAWLAGNGAAVFEACGAAGNCSQLGSVDNPNHADNLVQVPEPSRGVVLQAGCGGPYGSCSPSAVGVHRVLAKIHRATLTFEESVKPAAAIDGGTALAAGALSGTVTLQVRGTDNNGVYEFATSIGSSDLDRRVLNDNGGRCRDAGSSEADRFEFLYRIPCPTQAAGTVTIDTAKAPEGRQTLTVRVFDAAGNSEVAERTVTIDNIAPPRVLAPPTLNLVATDQPRPGDEVTTTEGQWSGTDVRYSTRWQRGDGTVWSDIPGAESPKYTLSKSDVGSRVRAVVSGRNSEETVDAPSAATALVQSGASIVGQTIAPSPGDGSTNGAGGDAASGQLVVDREQRSVEVPYGAKIVITGRLVDGEGRALADAEVDIYEQIVTTAAPWRKVTTIKTDSQGGYAYRPATTASRRLRFAYAARRGDADYRATRDVLVAVKAKMTATAARRVVKSGGLIKLRGRVTLEGLPTAGSWAELQVLDAGVWRTIGARRVSSRGLWTFKHRLRRSRGVTFRFRALLRAAGDVPAAESKSPTVKVRVR